MSSPGWTSKYVCALGSVAVLACGSVDNTPGGDDAPAGGDFTITTDPTSLTLPIAGSGNVTVTVQRTGAVGDIMLSASGLGANVSATFSPNPIPASATTSQATIAIAGGSAPATTSVMVTGSAGSTQHAATLSVTSTTITVTGSVRGNRSGVKVGIIGKQSVTSGAGGVFMFTDVTPPYDLYTFGDGGSAAAATPTVFLFKGLTRADPIVSAPTTSTLIKFLPCGILGGPCPNAPISGMRLGPGTNTDAIVFAWTGDGGTVVTPVLNSDGTYSATVQWRSGTMNTGFLHALQMTRKPSGAPNTFLGYAKTPGAIILMGGTAATINLTATPVNSTANLTGTLNGPGGNYPMPSISLFQQFGTTQAALWSTNTTNTVDATFPLIAASGTSVFASVALDDGSGTSSFVQPLTASVAVNFTMPAAAVLDAPADTATGVTTSTHFTWTSAASTINEVNLTTSDPIRAAFKIFTTASDVTIPVVPELTLPSNQSFSWRVVAYGPNANINEAAASSELESVTSADYQGSAHAQTFTGFRTFTSAP